MSEFSIVQNPTSGSKSVSGNGKRSAVRKEGRVRATSPTNVPPPTNPPSPSEIVQPPPSSDAIAPASSVDPATPPVVQKTPTIPQPLKEKTYSELYDDFLELMLSENPLSNRTPLNNSIRALLAHILKDNPVSQKYRTLIMFDNFTLMRQDTDKIYRALTALIETSKPIALIVNSAGGEVDAGYLISKLCREFSPDHFITIVPRRAKSAATLICCGADHIHMGSMSELGPIDPQVGGMPALGLKNAIQHLLDLAGQFPGAADVLAKYLNSSLKLINLGYYERVAESAVQYAERLLKKRKTHNAIPAETIANTLVYNYKDHGFVIDTGEAEAIFGPGVIITNSPEYNMANAVYSTLSSVESMCDAVGYAFYFYGSPDSPPIIYPKKK